MVTPIQVISSARHCHISLSGDTDRGRVKYRSMSYVTHVMSTAGYCHGSLSGDTNKHRSSQVQVIVISNNY